MKKGCGLCEKYGHGCQWHPDDGPADTHSAGGNKKGQQAFAPEHVAITLYKCEGLVTRAAKRLKCSPTTVERYIERYPVCREAMEYSREKIKDDAQHSLGAAVRRGEAWAVCFTLKCLAKDRGFVERGAVEVTGKDGGPIETRGTIDLNDLPLPLLKSIREALIKQKEAGYGQPN